nr:pitrilysin family protein [Idiomarina rhizosphaerae]
MFTLPNGLTTLVYNNSTVPNVFVGVWYRVGSKDEPKGKTGFAHLFEHLMFQQTPNRQQEYFLPFDKAGATGMNGTTNKDRTNYYATVPSNALDMALWMESDRMAHMADGITQEMLNEQREVVKNEKREGELKPGAKVHERFDRMFYPEGHPYAHSIIGSMDDLNNASLDDVKQWFEDYYGASNAVLVLAGDVDVDTAKAKVSYYFGDAPAGKPIDRVEQWVPSLDSVKRDIAYDKVGTATISRAWPLPNGDSKATSLLHLAGLTLTGSNTTPLQRILVDEKQVALNVSAGVSPSAISSIFRLTMTLRPGVTTEQADAALNDALQQYFTEGPDEDRLEAIATGANVSLIRSLESNSAIGNHLVNGYILQNDPLFFLKQRDWIRNASADEIRQLTKTWLSKPYFESVLLPLPKFQDGQVEVDRSEIPKPDAFDGKVTFPEITETTLTNGMKLVVAERHNLPVVDAILQFNTGSLAEKAYATDVATHTFGLLRLGTKRSDKQALTRSIDAIGMNFSSAAGERFSSVSWGSLTEYVDDSFGLVAEMLREPSFPQVEIDRIISNVDAFYDNYESNPMQASNAIYQRALWGKSHPYGKIDTRSESKQISRDAVVDFHDNEIGPNNATLYLIGDITLEHATQLANNYFGDWRQVQPSALGNVPVAEPEQAKIILLDVPGAQQSSITAGQLLAPFKADIVATETLVNDALGGSFHGRLNMNLREDKGWAYGFYSSISNAPKGQRVFSANGSVQTDKTAASMREIKREISLYIGDQPLTAEELERDRISSIRAIPSHFSSGASFLSSIVSSATFGLPYDRAEGTIGRYQQVQLKQARELAKQTFKPEQLTWVIAGDLSKIEDDIRALNFGEIEVWDIYGNKLR